jgi:hypothetical protein
MLMIKCKTCGEVFPGLYVAEDSNQEFRASATNEINTCSRGHRYEYELEDYVDWSWTFSRNSTTKVALVTYPDSDPYQCLLNAFLWEKLRIILFMYKRSCL